MLRLLEFDGVEIAWSGPNFVGLCPFHNERAGSFTVHAATPEHAHCYGCGWHGDIFDYWQARRNLDFLGAKSALAELAGNPVIEPKRFLAVECNDRPKLSKKPELPPLLANRAEFAKLAKLRGLSEAGIALAAAHGRVLFCDWPSFNPSPCWMVTDAGRWVAQFRRLDGKFFKFRDGQKLKAWTKGSPTWPLGAAEMKGKPCVLLVEGGADMLAAYHFLAHFDCDGNIAVVSILGSSMRICDEALAFFGPRDEEPVGKKVRILMDQDEAGLAAAARWTEQLTIAGAAVETFSLVDLTQPDGSAVIDLNDLARCPREVWEESEIRAAFFDFDF